MVECAEAGGGADLVEKQGSEAGVFELPAHPDLPDENGKHREFTLKQGDCLLFKERHDPNSGFQWVFEICPASTETSPCIEEDILFRHISQEPVGPLALHKGIPGTEQRKFVAKREGTALLRFDYVQPKLLKVVGGHYKMHYTLRRQVTVNVTAPQHTA